MAYLAILATVASVALCDAGEARNLVVDASFESPLPSWFAERQGTSYYAGKEEVLGAAEGRTVLAIEGWDLRGSRVLSPPIALGTDPAGKQSLSATVAVRSFGKANVATFELALVDEKGTKPLASFGRLTLDGQGTWQTMAKAGVTIDPPVKTGRLALVVAGPQEQMRVEVDRVGLFLGSKLQPVVDNSDLAVLEAEDLADGKVWKSVNHYDNWYEGTPSGMKMLAGFDGIKPEENHPVARRLPVRVAGPHVLWVRFQAGPYAGRFTATLRQHEATIAEKQFEEDDPRFGKEYHWVWDSLPADLGQGDVDLILSRPAAGASWVTRKIDLFVLSNRPGYLPEIEHFQPQGYLRFTNLSPNRNRSASGFLSAATRVRSGTPTRECSAEQGSRRATTFPRTRRSGSLSGERSPWVKISDYLLVAGGRNNVQFIATRKMHTEGFVKARSKAGWNSPSDRPAAL